MIRTKESDTKNIFLPVTPSTVMAVGDLLTFTSGKLVKAISTTAPVDIIGICGKTITATDADYALDRNIPVEVPTTKYVEFECDVTSGLVAADIGKEVDLTDAGTINRGASAIKVAKCTAVVSATKGQFLIKMNGSY